MGIDNLSSHSVYCSLECPTLNDYMPVISNLTVKLIKPRKNRTLLHPFNILCLSGPQVYASEYWEHGSWANSSTYLGSIQSSDGYCRDGLKKTYQPGILYHALTKQDLEGQMTLTMTQVAQKPHACPIHPHPCSWNVDFVTWRLKITRGLSHQKSASDYYGNSLVWLHSLSHAELLSLPEMISGPRLAFFGHITHLDDENVPSHQALQHHINLSSGHCPNHSWRHPCGQPSNRWIDQLRQYSKVPPTTLWQSAILQGHGQKATLQPRWLCAADDNNPYCRMSMQSSENTVFSHRLLTSCK